MSEVISIAPSEMVEGGAVPVDQNLTWKNPHFQLYDYNGKAPMTCAAMIKLVNDEGQEFEQAYSVASPDRFTPSADGKTLVAVGPAQAINKSSNFFILMTNLVNAGFPENKLIDSKGDISILDNLYAHHIGYTEPKRAGLTERVVPEGQTARPKVLSVPDKVLRLPWEAVKGKGGKAAAGAGKAAAPGKAPTVSADVTAKAVAFVVKAVEAAGGSTTRTDIASLVFDELKNDPDKDAVASEIFKPVMAARLSAEGIKVDGENVSKA